MVEVTMNAATVPPTEWPAGVTSGRGAIVFVKLRTILVDDGSPMFVGRWHRRGPPRQGFRTGDAGDVARGGGQCDGRDGPMTTTHPTREQVLAAARRRWPKLHIVY